MIGPYERWLFGGDLDLSRSPLVCPHSQLTFADEKGKAICMRCGSVVQTVLTLELLQASMDRIRDGR